MSRWAVYTPAVRHESHVFRLLLRSLSSRVARVGCEVDGALFAVEPDHETLICFLLRCCSNNLGRKRRQRMGVYATALLAINVLRAQRRGGACKCANPHLQRSLCGVIGTNAIGRRVLIARQQRRRGARHSGCRRTRWVTVSCDACVRSRPWEHV